MKVHFNLKYLKTQKIVLHLTRSFKMSVLYVIIYVCRLWYGVCCSYFVSKWSLLLSHLLERLLIRLQDVVGHVAHVPSSVSYLPPLPWHVQQLQEEMLQSFVAERDRSLCLVHTHLNGVPFSDGELFAVPGGEVVDNAQILRLPWAGGPLQDIRCTQRLNIWFWFCAYMHTFVLLGAEGVSN